MYNPAFTSSQLLPVPVIFTIFLFSLVLVESLKLFPESKPITKSLSLSLPSPSLTVHNGFSGSEKSYTISVIAALIWLN